MSNSILVGAPLSARPWLKRDTYFTRTNTGVKLTDTQYSFTIEGAGAYRAMVALAPYLKREPTLALTHYLGKNRRPCGKKHSVH